MIELSHLPPHLRGGEDGVCFGLPSGLTLAAIEKLAIRDALRRRKGNRAAAARELGIDASTLFRKLKALGIGERVHYARPPADSPRATGKRQS